MANSNRRKIMVVEDEAIPAMVMCNRLRKMGYTVLKPVATGEEAVHTAEIEHPDLILMDIRLAGSMDGITAAGLILAHIKTLIAFMTAFSNEEVMARARALKPCAYLTKPLENYELQNVLNKMNTVLH